jgi:hypothetical protein
MPSFTDVADEGYYQPHVPCNICCNICCTGRGQHYEDPSGRRRSMGPFAESLGMSTGVAMWIAVAQLPMVMGLALHYPTVRVDVFATSIRTALDPADNVTVAVASDDEAAVQVAAYEHGLGISGLYVLNAAAVTFFAVLSMNLIDRGVAALAAVDDLRSRHGISAVADEEFISQNVGMVVDPSFRMWNQASAWPTNKRLMSHGSTVHK